MSCTFETLSNGIALVKNSEEGPVIYDAQSALDLIATARYECDTDELVIEKRNIDARFFDLKTGLAGEVLQKFVNYGMQLAIVGDFNGYTSKSLRDFIYESNKGHVVCFAESIEQALVWLARQ